MLLLVALYVLVCLVLSLVILLQRGRGGDIASAFGGSSQAAFGACSGATLLTKATTVAAVLFMLLALTLSIIGQRGGSSVVSGTSAPTRPASAPAAPKPAPPAPAGSCTIDARNTTDDEVIIYHPTA